MLQSSSAVQVRSLLESMVKHCSIPGCTSRAGKEGCEGVSFHTIPKDPVLRQQWLESIRKPFSVTENSRVCSIHFEGGVKTSSSPIPTLFPWTKQTRPPPVARHLPPLPQAKRMKFEDELCEALDEAQHEIDECKERIEDLEEEVLKMKVEVFGLQRFAGSDGDITLHVL